jgi:hypothetical protein
MADGSKTCGFGGLFLVLAAGVAFGLLWCAAPVRAEECLDKQRCIDLHEGYCRYRVIRDKNCWYPSKADHLTIKREKEERQREPVSVIERHYLDKSRPPIADDPDVWPKPPSIADDPNVWPKPSELK